MLSVLRIAVVVLSVCGSLFLSYDSFAYDSGTNIPDKAPAQIRADLLQEPVERISVEGKTPLSFYKRQFEIAELDFYDMFNAANEIPDFTMFCRKRAPTGSRIKRTYCYPQYLLKRHAYETQNAIANTPAGLLAQGVVQNLPTMEQIEALVAREQQQALEYAEQLVKENPAMLEQLLKMKQAELVYLAKKSEREKRREQAQ